MVGQEVVKAATDLEAETAEPPVPTKMPEMMGTRSPEAVECPIVIRRNGLVLYAVTKPPNENSSEWYSRQLTDA